MEYRNLSINDRINLKATLMAFKNIAVQDWKRELDRKLYRYNRPNLKRTRLLHTDWSSSLISTLAGMSTLRFTFPMYGRFVDMGVGKGTSFGERRTWRRRRIDTRQVLSDATSTRRPVRWYSKRKGFTQHRLSEVLVKRYGLGMAQFVENQLTFTVGINL